MSLRWCLIAIGLFLLSSCGVKLSGTYHIDASHTGITFSAPAYGSLCIGREELSISAVETGQKASMSTVLGAGPAGLETDKKLTFGEECKE